MFQKIINKIADAVARRINSNPGQFLPPVQFQGGIFLATQRGELYYVTQNDGQFSVSRIAEIR